MTTRFGFGVATDINADGVVVYSYLDDPGGVAVQGHAFAWQRGVGIALPDPGGSYDPNIVSWANAINDAGDVVGHYATECNREEEGCTPSRAAIWRRN